MIRGTMHMWDKPEKTDDEKKDQKWQQICFKIQ
jgi:hypothetical protein